MDPAGSWEARMAERARGRAQVAAPSSDSRALPDRSTWPVPDELRNYSARDVLLWYFLDGWRRILGSEPRVVLDHDFGYHVVTDGTWQLTFVNVEQFPDERFPEADG